MATKRPERERPSLGPRDCSRSPSISASCARRSTSDWRQPRSQRLCCEQGQLSHRRHRSPCKHSGKRCILLFESCHRGVPKSLGIFKAALVPSAGIAALSFNCPYSIARPRLGTSHEIFAPLASVSEQSGEAV